MASEYRITSSNKRERTITISSYTDGKLTSKYRNYRLTKEDFRYYTSTPTQHDIYDFLKSDDYYILK